MAASVFSRWIIPLIILLVAIAGFIVLRATGPTAPTPERSERVWAVRGLEITPGIHQPSLILYGRVTSPHAAQIRSAVEGEIAAVSARAGAMVPADTLLVRIDPNEAELILRQREAEYQDAVAALGSEELRAETDRRSLAREREILQIAQRGMERARDLRSRDLGSEAALDEASRVLEQARLALEVRQQGVSEAPIRHAQLEARRDRAAAARDRAQLDLERTLIRATEDARITEVQVSAGERVRVGDPLLRLYPVRDLEIRASLPEAWVPQLRELLSEGAQPLLAQAQVDGQTIVTELVRLAAETRVGEAGISGLFAVHSGIEHLPLNRFVMLQLALPPEANSVVIPFSALYGRDRIYRIVEQRMQALQVERLGEIALPDGRTLALVRHPDLLPGDILVATRLPNAIDGLRVQVSEWSDPFPVLDPSPDPSPDPPPDLSPGLAPAPESDPIPGLDPSPESNPIPESAPLPQTGAARGIDPL